MISSILFFVRPFSQGLDRSNPPKHYGLHRSNGLGSPDFHDIGTESALAREAELGFNRPVGKRLLNVREAAQYLGLEVDTVYKKARLRELPSVKVGRALRFDQQALDRLIEQHTIETID